MVSGESGFILSARAQDHLRPWSIPVAEKDLAEVIKDLEGLGLKCVRLLQFQLRRLCTAFRSQQDSEREMDLYVIAALLGEFRCHTQRIAVRPGLEVCANEIESCCRVHGTNALEVQEWRSAGEPFIISRTPRL